MPSDLGEFGMFIHTQEKLRHVVDNAQFSVNIVEGIVRFTVGLQNTLHAACICLYCVELYCIEMCAASSGLHHTCCL